MLGVPGYDDSVKRRREWYKRNGFDKQLIETDEIGGFDAKKIEKVIEDRVLA